MVEPILLLILWISCLLVTKEAVDEVAGNKEKECSDYKFCHIIIKESYYRFNESVKKKEDQIRRGLSSDAMISWHLTVGQKTYRSTLRNLFIYESCIALTPSYM